jgi:hypothetical protein
VSSEQSELGELLNDDSFIYWLKQDERLSGSMKKKWDDWLSSDKRNSRLAERAKKIIELPFKEEVEDCDKEELLRLKEAIKKDSTNSLD